MTGFQNRAELIARMWHGLRSDQRGRSNVQYKASSHQRINDIFHSILYVRCEIKTSYLVISQQRLPPVIRQVEPTGRAPVTERVRGFSDTDIKQGSTGRVGAVTSALVHSLRPSTSPGRVFTSPPDDSATSSGEGTSLVAHHLFG